jgi:hypothetical protein
MKELIDHKSVCEKLGEDPNHLPTITGVDEDFANLVMAEYRLSKARKAIVGNWKANYADGSRKWFPVFIWDTAAGAFRFLYAVFDCTNALAGCGARHTFEKEEQAIHFGKTFIDDHNIVLIEESKK